MNSKLTSLVLLLLLVLMIMTPSTILSTYIPSVYAAAGSVGKALNFDGLDDYVSMGLISQLPELDFGMGDSFTIEFWLRTTQEPANPIELIGTYSSPTYPTPDQFYMVSLASGGLARGYLRVNDGGASAWVLSTSVVNNGLWHHIAFVKDVVNGNLSIYVDGSLEDTSGFVDGETVNDGEFHLADGHWNRYYQGLIDEVRVYNKTLSTAEVSYRYNAGVGLYGRPEPGLVAGWHFDEGIGTTAGDYSGNGNDGTISGAVWVDGHVLLPDVAIINVTPAASKVVTGESVDIDVTAKNLGGAHEGFVVTAYYDNNLIGTETVTDLGKGLETALVFTWDTTGVPLGVYTIKANASIVQGETNTTNNELINGTIEIIKPPVANFIYSPDPVNIGLPASFDATSSTPNGGSIVSYKWDFDDGNVTSTTNPVITHTYALYGTGTYNVTLTVFDDEGLNDTCWALVPVIVHDVAVVDVTPFSNRTYVGRTVSINVTITNEGNATETFSLTLYYNITAGDIIGTETVTDLLLGEHRNVTFLWDTTDVKTCRNYTMTAVAQTLPGEADILDNTLNGTTLVRVVMVGDVDMDGVIGVEDIFSVAVAFGTCPGYPDWDEWCDVDFDGVISITDIFTIAINFGKTCP